MSIRSRKFEEKLFIIITGIAGLITSILFILIISRIAIEAIPALNLQFITNSEFSAKRLLGGLANAIVGTILISVCSVIISTPFAVGTAIYLKKYARENYFTKMAHFMIELLAGTPSIIFGLVGLLLLVYYLKPITGGYSLISGSIALAVLILPVIERATEEAIHTLDPSLEDASYALGATKWDTIKRIVIPCSLSGIITGMIIGIGRSAEESAVVIMTAGYTQFIPSLGIGSNPKLLFGIQILPFQDLVGTLPIAVYEAFEFPNQIPMANGFAAALVLIVIVMTINMIARLILWRWKIG